MIVPEKSQELIIDAADAESLEAEALIKEARQRQRKRQLFIAVVVLVVALGSVIWVASAAGTRAPSSNKTGPGKSAGGAGLAGSRHANPLQLVGVWRVTGTGQHRPAIASIGGLGLVVWQSCGWMSGDWNANQQGLFAGILSGGVPACASSYASLNPAWLAATGYKGDGRDELLLAADGRVLAHLVPTTVPPSYARAMSPDYLHPVVTPQLRKVLLQVSRPLPSGLAQVSTKQLRGRWGPAKASPGHAPHQAYLSFNADGDWSGSDGCNGLYGRWSLGSGATILVATGPQTTMACTGMTPVGGWLSQATRAAFQGSVLVFVNAGGKVTGRLRRE
ncbi:MAG: META domain-containing protein [Acidimicrobiales bacterium]